MLLYLASGENCSCFLLPLFPSFFIVAIVFACVTIIFPSSAIVIIVIVVSRVVSVRGFSLASRRHRPVIDEVRVQLMVLGEAMWVVLLLLLLLLLRRVVVVALVGEGVRAGPSRGQRRWRSLRRGGLEPRR